MAEGTPYRTRYKLSLPIVLVGLLVSSCSLQKSRPILLPKQLHEISGLVYVNSGEIYAHNDGDNPSHIYLLDQKGRMKDSMVDALRTNQDMEAMARDDSTRLYIGDIGNNRREAREYTIYRYDPKTRETHRIQFFLSPAKDRETWPNFEAMIWARDSLWVFTKGYADRGPFYSDLYAFPSLPGTHKAHWKGRLFPKNFVITGATIDRHMGQVTLVGYRLRKFLGIPRLPTHMWILSEQEGLPFWVDEGRRYSLSPWGIGKPIEAVDKIEKGTWLLGSERSPLHRAQIQVARMLTKSEK
ncbi:MAG: hypothetical protein AAF694_12755 [Bacteroidota bacterium]